MVRVRVRVRVGVRVRVRFRFRVRVVLGNLQVLGAIIEHPHAVTVQYLYHPPA